MKSVDQLVGPLHNRLVLSAQAKNVSLNSDIFSLILQGASIQSIEQQIKNKESGQSLKWHLVELIEAARKIHEEVHKCFHCFWSRQVKAQIPVSVLEELGLAAFAKNGSIYCSILKNGGLNDREVVKVANSLYNWLDEQFPRMQSHEQRLFIVFKKLETPYRLRLFTPTHKDIYYKQCWTSKTDWTHQFFTLLEFKLPAGSDKYEFRMGDYIRLQPLEYIAGEETCFLLNTAFLNLSAPGFEKIVPAEELCAMCVLLTPKDFLKFLKVNARNRHQRNKCYFDLLSMPKHEYLERLFERYLHPFHQRQLCYMLANIAYEVDEGAPRIPMNGLVSKMFLKCPKAAPETVDQSLKDLDNCFRLTKLYVHWRSSSNQSTELFDSLLDNHVQRNLRRLIGFLEEDNKQKRILKINSEQLLLAVKDSNTSGLILLHMIVVIIANRCWREKTNNAQYFAAQISMFNDRMVDQAVQEFPHVSEAICVQVKLLNAFELDWKKDPIQTILNLHRGLTRMYPQYFDSAKLKASMHQEICSQMKLPATDNSVKFLSEIFVKPSRNPIFEVKDLEQPAKHLLTVRWTWSGNVSFVVCPPVLTLFLSQILFPLTVSKRMSHQSQKGIIEVLAESIIYSKLSFEQMLVLINNALDVLQGNHKLVEYPLQYLINCLVLQPSAAYNWEQVIIKGEWIRVFSYHELLHELFVDDLTRRLNKERSNNSDIAELEESLYTIFQSKSKRLTNELKATLVKGFFGLRVSLTKSHLKAFLFDSPQRIRAYCLLLRVASEECRSEILRVAEEIKVEIDNCNVSRNQLKQLEHSCNDKYWGFISELFDQKEGPGLRRIVRNIEASCELLVVNLEQTIAFCSHYKSMFVDSDSIRSICQAKLQQMKQGSCCPIVLTLDPLSERLKKITKDLDLLQSLMAPIYRQQQRKVSVRQFCEVIEKEIQETVIDIERRTRSVNWRG